jgi:hypothetical protein
LFGAPVCRNLKTAQTSRNELTNVDLLVGVGGWANHGIDPRNYAVALAEEAKKEADSGLLAIVDPVYLMRTAYLHSLNVKGGRYFYSLDTLRQFPLQSLSLPMTFAERIHL